MTRQAAEAGQASLFDDLVAEPVLSPVRDAVGSLSVMRDKDSERLEKLVFRLRDTTDALERARAASQLSDLAQTMCAKAVRDAVQAGHTWRALGNELGVPFQTLYGRYGSAERS